MNPIYDALSAWRVFIFFKLVPIEGKPKFDKVPVDPFTLRNSNAQDPSTWMLPGAALSMLPLFLAQLPHGGGIGIVIYEGSGLFCLDLDGVLVDGVPTSPVVPDMLARFPGAYVETSVSGRGLHILGRYAGAPPLHSTRNADISAELYTKGRFIALSPEGAGNVLSDHTEQLWALAMSHFVPTGPADATDPKNWTTEPDPACPFKGTDGEILALARSSKSMRSKFSPEAITFEDIWQYRVEKFAKVWPGNDGDPFDASSVDLSFFDRLAYWTGNNCEAMLRIAQREDCRLRREKWEREDYLQRSILKAVALPKADAWKAAARRGARIAENLRKFGPAAPPSIAPPAAIPLTVIPPPPVSLAGPPQEAIALTSVPPPPSAALTAVSPPPAPPEAAPALPAGVPEPPAAMPAIDVLALQYIGGSHMGALFEGYAYVNDMHRIVGPDGFVMDKAKFDAHPRFAKREFMMDLAGEKKGASAWDAFLQSQQSPGVKVRGALFDPRLEPGAVILREGVTLLNTWRPPHIEVRPGDVTPFINHLRILFADWPLLLNYLKFMMQFKGTKAMYWPFIYGMPGNGKSFINATMRYCIGRPPLTASPKASNIDSQFNSMLYGCLFIAIEDIKVAEDYQKVWEAIKPMVTQTELEIEYKGVDKVTREICFNAILNSNHKNGIRKEPDDRRIMSLFSRQQKVGDLERDGLTDPYFEWLWTWAQTGGWAHVAHYLSTSPIEGPFSHTKCPITSSTAEHIAVSRSAPEQLIIEQIRTEQSGYRGGWINLARVNMLLDSHRYKMSLHTRRAMVEGLGYVPHPGLIDGQLPMALADLTTPVLFITPRHASATLTDAHAIKAAYEKANR